MAAMTSLMVELSSFLGAVDFRVISSQRLKGPNKVVCHYCCIVSQDTSVHDILLDIFVHQGRLCGSVLFDIMLQHIIYGVPLSFSLSGNFSILCLVFRALAVAVAAMLKGYTFLTPPQNAICGPSSGISLTVFIIFYIVCGDRLCCGPCPVSSLCFGETLTCVECVCKTELFISHSEVSSHS